MTNKTIQFVLMSPERVVFDQPVTQAHLRGTDGDLGLLPGHVRLITSVAISPLRVTLENGQEQKFLVHGGTLDVTPERIRLLSDLVEKPEEIDAEQARKTKEELETKLKGDVKPEEEPKLRHELEISRARLAITSRHGH